MKVLVSVPVVRGLLRGRRILVRVLGQRRTDVYVRNGSRALALELGGLEHYVRVNIYVHPASDLQYI